MPAWVGDDGFPLSWRHFVYGMAYLGRQHNRDLLAGAQAIRHGMSTGDDFDAWSRDVEMITGVPRHG